MTIVYCLLAIVCVLLFFCSPNTNTNTQQSQNNVSNDVEVDNQEEDDRAWDKKGTKNKSRWPF